MNTTVHGYGALSAGATVEPYTFERRTPRSDDVVIDILYCGICHSDLHQVCNDWGPGIFPMVPGHEIVGRVSFCGENAQRFSVGELVAVGCMVDSCRVCKPCQNHLEQYCTKQSVFTYNSVDPRDNMNTYGGYSKNIVVTEKFVLKVPKNLDMKSVAPILCAGITTWSPLKHWGVKKGTKLGVIGLGGLGHMALKLGRALEADITLFTRSPQKGKDARRLGANHVVLSTDSKQMKEVEGAFDLIIDTVPEAHDLNPYIQTLALDGTLVLVGLLGHIEPSINSVPMIMGRKTIAGSVIGGIEETQELLDFCGQHNIVPDVEMIKMEAVNEAFERMKKSDVKYRFVIDVGAYTP